MKIKIFLFIIFSLFVTFLFLLTQITKNKLKEKHIVKCAKIVSYCISRGGPLLKFTYNYDGIVYNNELGCLQLTLKKYQNGLNHIFIVLDKNNPSTSFILETNDDFGKYKIIQTDTIGTNCNY